MRTMKKTARLVALAAVVASPSLLSAGCSGSKAPEGLAEATPANVTVKVDFEHRPFPEMPLPSDLATRYDPSSPTGLRLNASRIGTSIMDRNTRKRMDELDGWGTFGSITIPFTGDIDVNDIIKHHRDPEYNQDDDVIYVFNITPSSPNFGKPAYIDLGEGNFPKVVKEIEGYWPNDPRGENNTILFEEVSEDKNGDGILQPEEDTDCDAVLDKPNYLPGLAPAKSDLAARADALMTFYEKETHTVIAHPVVPLDERTTYAVVVTKRLHDMNGNPVGSPYAYINNASQTERLQPLKQVLTMHGMTLKDVAFTWAYTTGSMTAGLKAVRNGIYGKGAQKHLSKEYPPDMGELLTLRDDGDSKPYLVPSKMFVKATTQVLKDMGEELVPGGGKETIKDVFESHKFIDYHIVGTFDSAQLFPRKDADGNMLALDDQVWPANLESVPAPARSEKVTFWLTIPRKEVSRRKDGKPAPVALLANGYQTNKFEAFTLAGYFARFGVASLIIEAVSHGFEMSDLQRGVIQGMFDPFHLSPMAGAIFQDRAFDQNGDGIPDSGADFWTAYAFHTRDVLRQTVFDYMQLVRIIRAMDGKRQWNLKNHATEGLAGDFDGDGKLDIGGDAPILMFGGSLGGIVGTITGGAEPGLTAVATVSAGGGLAEGAIRSLQGGIREAFILRMMAPMYLGTPDPNRKGSVNVEALMPNLAKKATVKVGALTDIKPGDSIVLTNLDNDEVSCALVDDKGAFRVGVASDQGDHHRIDVYDGTVFTAKKRCELQHGASRKLKSTMDKFGNHVHFQYWDYEQGDALAALGEGRAMRRSTPKLRRLAGLAQHILDPADPAVWAQYLGAKTLHYPLTNETVNTRAMILTTVGDMGVPDAMGVNIGRSAGIIDFLHADPRHGVPVNQVLIDQHLVEGVNTTKRFTMADGPHKGEGVLFDVDNYSEWEGEQGHNVPRFSKDKWLRITKPMRGGIAAAPFLYVDWFGTHGGAFPGMRIDMQVGECRDACDTKDGDDPCGCEAKYKGTFDVGMYEVNMIAHYLQSLGTRADYKPCMWKNTCSFIPPVTVLGDDK